MPKSFRSFDRMIIPAPCDADWESMIGNDRVRFCEHCNLHVTNLSNVTRQEAMRLVARSEGRLCVRFVRRNDGSIVAKQSEKKLHQISRRVSRLAAGAFTATLSLTSAAAQSSTSEQPTGTVQTLHQREPVIPSGFAALSGTLTDPMGAVIPGATVTLVNSSSGEETTVSSNDEGEYAFENVSPGAYVLKIAATGFKTLQINGIELQLSASQRQDSSLEVGEITGTAGAVVFIEPENPLVKAAFEDDLEAVKELSLVAPDINAPDKNTHTTALEQAVENGNLEIVRTLILAGASPEAKDTSGRTALMYLRSDATGELVRELISAGAEVNARDESGGTALMNAASECKYEIVKELIDAGAKVDFEDADGKTALMFAAGNNDGDTSIAKLLIDAGANVNAKDHEGKTALMVAADEGDPETIKLLLSFNADVNAVDNRGKSAVIYIAETNDQEGAVALLNAGADLSLRDDEGKTALTHAKERPQPDLIKLLESRGAPE